MQPELTASETAGVASVLLAGSLPAAGVAAVVFRWLTRDLRGPSPQIPAWRSGR